MTDNNNDGYLLAVGGSRHFNISSVFNVDLGQMRTKTVIHFLQRKNILMHVRFEHAIGKQPHW